MYFIYVADERGFKNTFYKELLPELKAKGKTVLVISHDEQYFGAADRIVRLDYGQVVENNFCIAAPSTIAKRF